MQNFVTHLEAAIDGTRLAAGQIHTLHNGRPHLGSLRSACNPQSRHARKNRVARPRHLAMARTVAREG